MSGEVGWYLSQDHRRLEDLFQKATVDSEKIDNNFYMDFRGGLLRHIGMEEKVLLPAARVAQAGEALPLAARLRLDHGALAALLVMTPTPSIVSAIRKILESARTAGSGRL